jgi:hypothetical protein
MRDLHRPFCETLFDWDSEPSNKRTSTLFQPKGLGTVLPGGHRRHGARRVISLAIGLVAIGAGMVALAAFARFFHLGII